jgi:hypothetical protein
MVDHITPGKASSEMRGERIISWAAILRRAVWVWSLPAGTDLFWDLARERADMTLPVSVLLAGLGGLVLVLVGRVGFDCCER